MTQVKFYRVETLPEVGEVGSLYFVYGSGGVQSLLYICVGTGLFELYTPDLYELENKMDSLEDKVEAESQAIQHKIDNIKLPEIDTTELAKESTLNAMSSKLDNLNVEVDLSSVSKQGENQEATNSAIYALLSQFGESVLQEHVYVHLDCADIIQWDNYNVGVIIGDEATYIPLSENGSCSFSIKIGQEYSVQLPLIGSYIQPIMKTYTAITAVRDIYFSYVVTGLFGIDELGRRYSVEQVEKLENKSIIKFVGVTNDVLENTTRVDGKTGCGFMFPIGDELVKGAWSTESVILDKTYLPQVTASNVRNFCDGLAYTTYMKYLCENMEISSPIANSCLSKTLTVNSEVKQRFLIAPYQQLVLLNNNSSLSNLYNALGSSIPDLYAELYTSGQGSDEPISPVFSYYNKMQYSSYGFAPGYKVHACNGFCVSYLN